MIVNLKEETIKILSENGKTWDDVEWVGTEYGKIDKSEFLNIIDKEYDNSFCANIGGLINPYIMVVGKDFWLERKNDEITECWEFKTFPMNPIFISDLKVFMC